MTQRPLHILVPRPVDADNFNAQNLNARAMLPHFNADSVVWHVLHYGAADPRVLNNPRIVCHQLARGRWWVWHAIWLYQGSFDAIFYPGNEWFDALALSLRALLRRRIPVIATLEGVPGDENREAHLGEQLGRRVYCFRPRSGSNWTRHHDAVKNQADVIIAISPYLQRIARLLYDKPGKTAFLGVDTDRFYPAPNPVPASPLRVISAGTLYAAKRPEIFLVLARRFPGTHFIWYGEGPQRGELQQQTRLEGLHNLEFPGALPPAELSAAFRMASLFILPSLSEGVPKVTQEASACGLPVIAFSHYESPMLVNEVNGFSVQTDAELVSRTEQILASPELRAKFRANALTMSQDWHWPTLARQWQELILAAARS